MNNNLKYMQIAIKEAKKAAKRGDVPVGAVIVYKDKIYVTLEPCMMCTGAIVESRIKNIYYATKSDKYGSLNKITKKNKTKMQIDEGICKEESIDILKNFFKEKRK